MKKRTAGESGFKLRAGVYTAEQVINHAIKQIEEEPKRLRMASWVSAVCGRIVDEDAVNSLPACGTAACAGGWIGLALGREIHGASQVLDLLGLPNGSNISCGCSTCKAQRAEHSNPEFNAAFDLSRLFQRTSEEAKTIVPALKALVETHKGVLQSKIVKVPSREELRHAR